MLHVIVMSICHIFLAHILTNSTYFPAFFASTGSTYFKKKSHYKLASLTASLYIGIAMLYAQDDVVGSGYITAVTLQQKFNYSGKAYVLGTPSLGAELSQVGITAIGTGVSICSCCHRHLYEAAFTLT